MVSTAVVCGQFFGSRLHMYLAYQMPGSSKMLVRYHCPENCLSLGGSRPPLCAEHECRTMTMPKSNAEDAEHETLCRMPRHDW